MIKTIVTLSSIIILCSLAAFNNNDSTENISSTDLTISETGPVNWITIEEAEAALKKDPRPIMIDVYTKWCGPCKMMSANTFTDARVAEYLNANYYCVKFDAESPEIVNFAGKVYANPDYVANQPGRNGVHEFSRFLNVSAYPTLFFMDKTANGLGPVSGYRTPAQLEIYLHYFKEEKYVSVRTQEEWAEYEKAFVVTWN